MMFSVPQTEREELLDKGSGSEAEVRRSLRDIARINRYLGGSQVAVNGCIAMLEKRGLQRATVLDLGTGLGEIPRQLENAARARGIEIQTVGIDNNRRHLKWAKLENPNTPLLCQCDAFALPFADKSIDIVMSSLFVHHFRAPQIVQLLRECSRVCRVGWLMNDIVRHLAPLWFFRTTWPIFARSHLTRYDGTVSLRRSYTALEMQQIVRELPNVQVRAHIPFRMSIGWENEAKA